MRNKCHPYRSRLENFIRKVEKLRSPTFEVRGSSPWGMPLMRSDQPCSRCGYKGHGLFWYNYVAHYRNANGEYLEALCGDGNGYWGCLQATVPFVWSPFANQLVVLASSADIVGNFITWHSHWSTEPRHWFGGLLTWLHYPN